MGTLSHGIGRGRDLYGRGLAIAQDLLSPSLISRLIAIRSVDRYSFSRSLIIHSLDRIKGFHGRVGMLGAMEKPIVWRWATAQP